METRLQIVDEFKKMNMAQLKLLQASYALLGKAYVWKWLEIDEWIEGCDYLLLLRKTPPAVPSQTLALSQLESPKAAIAKQGFLAPKKPAHKESILEAFFREDENSYFRIK
jgi:hypothetical protein